jgi:GTP-binding protein HflX
VLEELGAADKPRITVFNKIDLLDLPHEGVPLPADQHAAFVSAVDGRGLPSLLAQVAAALHEQMIAVDAVVPYDRGELVALARSSGDVEERYLPAGVRISGHLPPSVASAVDAAGRRRAAR